MVAANMDANFVEAVNSVLAPLEAKMCCVLCAALTRLGRQQEEADMVAAGKAEDYDTAAELSESLERLKAE